MGKIYKYTNIVLETIQRNNRKINAIIRRSQIRRIKVYIMLLGIIISVINPIYAIDEKECRVFCRIDDKVYVKYAGNPQPNYEYYYNIDNRELPIYCVNLGMKGAEAEKDGYVVNVKNSIADEKLKEIIFQCYPYQSLEKLGVDTIEQAKFASQFAIWIYTANLNPELLEPMYPEYKNVVEAIKNIYYFGMNSNNRIFNLTVSEQRIENINGESFYIREIEPTDKYYMDYMKVIAPQESSSIIKNKDGYKICVPVDTVDEGYQIDIDIEFANKVALYGESTKEGFQDVIITVKEEVALRETYIIPFENMKSKVTIVKKDKDTNTAIEGIKYEIRDENHKVIGEYKTDDNGKIELEVLNTKNIFVKEIEAADEYVLDNNTYNFSLNTTFENIFELYNVKKTGNIKIIKKTKEYNELTGLKENMPLQNVSFYIYDQNMNLIDDVTTDEFGCAITKRIPVGKYYIKEYKTYEHYQLLDELIEAEIIENDDITNIEILNNNVDIPKKLPVTGR